MATPRKPTAEADDDPHTELRRQGEEAPDATSDTAEGADAAETPPKPRTPVERLPLDDDGDDLFNDIPV
jgi:hypothetical protein